MSLLALSAFALTARVIVLTRLLGGGRKCEGEENVRVLKSQSPLGGRGARVLILNWQWLSMLCTKSTINKVGVLIT